MACSLVQQATREGLISPDWALNMDICDVLNRDPGQAKGVVKKLKKRINSKSSKIQLLALTLLETLMKNCGEIVHAHIAEKDIPHKMVKIVKKKPDFHVKEKILVLIDTWQEAFGGPRARYPQYYTAYQELLQSGAVFPQRNESSVPIFTPPPSQPITSHPKLMRSPYFQQDVPQSSALDFATLSSVEIQNARGIMNVLAEMLNALDPANKEALRQEVIVDLVEQCRSYKQRVMHLVDTTSNEELLREGLALNDDLEQVLGKHDTIAAGIVQVKPERSLTPTDVGNMGNSDDVSTQSNQRSPPITSGSTSNQHLFDQLLLPAPPSSEKDQSKTALVKMDPNMDLLSGDDYNTKRSENALAIVPINANLETSASDQNVLALADMFSQNDNANINNTSGSKNPYSLNSAPGKPPISDDPPVSPLRRPALHSNGGVPNPNIGPARHFQGSQLNSASPMWNGQAAQSLNLQQQPPISRVNVHGGDALPPPPWETQPNEVDQPVNLHAPTMQGTQLLYPSQLQSPHFSGINSYPMQMQNGQIMGQYSYPLRGWQMAGMQLLPQIQGNQMWSAGKSYIPQSLPQPYNQIMPSYTHTSPNEISQIMYGLSLQGSRSGVNTNSYQTPASSSPTGSTLQQPQQPLRPSEPEDKLFGDLLNIAKSKQGKSNIS